MNNLKSGWYYDPSKSSSGFRIDRVGGKLVGTLYCHEGNGSRIWFELQSLPDDPTTLAAYAHVGAGFPFPTSSVATQVGIVRFSNITENAMDCYWELERTAFENGANIPSPTPVGKLSGNLQLRFMFNGE